MEFTKCGASSLKLTSGTLPAGEYAVSKVHAQGVICFGVDQRQTQERNIQTIQDISDTVRYTFGTGPDKINHHAPSLKLLLLALVAIVPITSGATAARKTPARSTTTRKPLTKKPIARAAAAGAAKPRTTSNRKKTESVSGYTSKSGKKVAPYKRSPAK